jgi:hypothetical protein
MGMPFSLDMLGTACLQSGGHVEGPQTTEFMCLVGTLGHF